MFIELTSFYGPVTYYINVNQIHKISSKGDISIVSTSKFDLEVKESGEEILKLIQKSYSAFNPFDVIEFNPHKLHGN